MGLAQHEVHGQGLHHRPADRAHGGAHRGGGRQQPTCTFARWGLNDSYLGLVIVHAALGAPFVVTTVLATLQSFNHNLVKASLSLGASPLETFFRVTLPVIAPGVISGALFAFATSFDEVVVTLFLAGPEQVTLPRQMFTGIRENISPTIAAVATLLILFTTALMLTLEWLRGRRK
jgi:putative spermidine/putrescine transport system permease protein